MKKPKTLTKISKGPDLETHVRRCWIGGKEFVELRDYIPSTKTYSRGVVFERHLTDQMIEGLGLAR